MINYKVENNIVIATFRRKDWEHSIGKHYNNEISTDTMIILDVVFSVVGKLRKSGMKFYGEAKCSPEDTFNEKIGKRLAKKRLLAKYNRVLSMIDKELLKVLQNDIDFINRYKVEHKERSNYVQD